MDLSSIHFWVCVKKIGTQQMSLVVGSIKETDLKIILIAIILISLSFSATALTLLYIFKLKNVEESLVEVEQSSLAPNEKHGQRVKPPQVQP